MKFWSLIFVLALFSCSSAPKSVEQYILNSDSVTNLYEFELDMSDSTSMYNLNIYTAHDYTDREFNQAEQVELLMKITSPGGKSFSETVFLPKDKVIRENYFTKFYKLPYRKGIAPDEHGVWRFSVEYKNKKDLKKLRGIGIQLENYGKR